MNKNPAAVDPRTIDPAELLDLAFQLYARCCALNVSTQVYHRMKALRREVERRMFKRPESNTPTLKTIIVEVIDHEETGFQSRKVHMGVPKPNSTL